MYKFTQKLISEIINLGLKIHPTDLFLKKYGQKTGAFKQKYGP